MLFDQIASNKRRTWVLLIAFFALLAIIGAAVGYYRGCHVHEWCSTSHGS